MPLNPKVDTYLKKTKQWRDEIERLRTIILDCHLAEELKWGKPCYSYQDSNVVIIQGFKNYCAILFFKGVLLKDPKGILQKTGENTRVGRQIRFANVQEIDEMQANIKAYIKEAIRVEKAGLKTDISIEKLVYPAELKKKFAENPAFKSAFEALTPGRQRGYNIYFSSAKQSQTRDSRIEKCLQNIFKGKGLNDR
ncbi:MAG: YdeI/OmpD-associated family protein [Oligoflexus sp.]